MTRDAGYQGWSESQRKHGSSDLRSSESGRDSFVNLQMCYDQPPRSSREKMTRQAIEANPDNEAWLAGHVGLELAFDDRKLWPNHTVLGVRFLDGEEELRELVKAKALEWTALCGIDFDFDSKKAKPEIRVSFDGRGESGAWSYRGTDALDPLVRSDEPTMVLGWTSLGSSPADLSRAVLHEFGHALGAIHEHIRADHGIPWDGEKVLRYFTGLDPEQRVVEFNRFFRTFNGRTRASQYDPYSIMHYQIDPRLTIDGWDPGWSTELSDLDKEWVASVYPL